MTAKEEALKNAKESGVKLVNLQFTDILGTLKSIIIPAEELENSIENGTWFDGSSVEGFARIHESDMYLKPNPETFALLPWVSKENPTARVICDVYAPDGTPFDGCPRNVLKRAMAKAREMGFIYNTGPELEFFFFKRDEHGKIALHPSDEAGYFDYAPRDKTLSTKREIIFALQSMGIYVERSHHEVAKGQHEIGFRYNNALTQADHTQTFKHTVKSVANLHNLYATFMPKPVAGINGSGMHVHQSLFNLDRKNAFYDQAGVANLSKTARSFIAGQLEHIKEITAVTNPLVNSYKRLVPGYEAPVYICWAQRNRSALIRVPMCHKGGESAVRAELRCPDPSANPYLVFALMLSAGLDGIERGLEPPEPVNENVYHLENDELAENKIDTLPGSLKESLEIFKKSKLARETLGEHVFRKYIEAKEKEWDSYRLHVTDWEVANYLERI